MVVTKDRLNFIECISINGKMAGTGINLKNEVALRFQECECGCGQMRLAMDSKKDGLCRPSNANKKVRVIRTAIACGIHSHPHSHPHSGIDNGENPNSMDGCG